MSLSRRAPIISVHSAAEGIRTAARLARLKTSMVTGSDASEHRAPDPIAEAFAIFADELDVIAAHIDELGGEVAKAQ